MAILRRGRTRRLTAAAGGVVKGGSPATPDAILRRTQDWQRRVLAYHDSIPEVGHAGVFVNNVLGKTRMVVSVDGQENLLLTGLLREFPLGRVSRNLFLVGECIVAYKYQRDKSTVSWVSFGKDDYKAEANRPLLVRKEDGKFKPLDNDWSWFRVWRESVGNQYQAWSSFEPLLDVLEALYVHQLADTAVATSRLAGAGILYIPNDELSDVKDMDGGEPEKGSQAHLEMRLRDAMQDSVRNRNSEDAIVPLVMFGSAEYADAIKHVLMERRDDAEAFERRINAYRKRVGGGIDLPEEVITGMGDTTHWASWKVDQNTWNYYLEPLGDIQAQAVERNFISGIVGALGVRGVVTVSVDATRAIVKPDRTDAGIRLYAAGALSGEGALHYAGMDARFIHPHANDPRGGGVKTQPDGMVRMPSANFRDSEGEPVGDRNMQR